MPELQVWRCDRSELAAVARSTQKCLRFRPVGVNEGASWHFVLLFKTVVAGQLLYMIFDLDRFVSTATWVLRQNGDQKVWDLRKQRRSFKIFGNSG